MKSHLRANLLLLAFTVAICCVLYPAILYGFGQTLFPSAAAGSPIVENGQVRGSSPIAQPFTADEYFWPRPSAAGYNGTASGASNWGANNPKLRDRVAQFLGPIVQFKKASRFYTGAEPTKAVQRDIAAWFAAKPGRLADWEAEFEVAAANWKQSNTTPPSGPAIPALFFEMWLRDPANAERVADLEPVAADMVMASASGLDPHVSLRNALSVYQLDRVAAKRSADATAIAALVRRTSFTPLGGLVGEPLVSVLELNLAMDREFPLRIAR